MSARWTKFRIPEVYYNHPDEPDLVLVPVEVAGTEAEAFEHLLTDQSDWSMREDLREGVASDWRYLGVRRSTICRHDYDQGCGRGPGCRLKRDCHAFELVAP